MHTIKLSKNGSFEKLTKYMFRIKDTAKIKCAEKYAEKGLEALRVATPKDTGNTANSWSYTITRARGKITIQYANSNVNNGVNVAVLLQLGHGTGTGGYVTGVDYINPALKPVFSDLANEAWKEMTSIE